MEDRSKGTYEQTGILRLLFALPAFRNAVHGPVSSGMAIGQLAAVGMTSVALVLRFYLDPLLPPGFPYLTFFPCVVITGFVWGIFPAITAGILSGLASWYWFIQPLDSFSINGPAATALAFYVFVIATDIGLLFLALRALGAQVRAHEALTTALEMQQLVSAEVDHRLKNLMATINGLVSMLHKHASTPGELADQLRQRINGLGHSITLLRGVVEGERISLRKAIQSTLEPLGLMESERVALEGPQLTISPNGLIPLNLILHELGTNAVKHGAFSNQSGTIRLIWDVLIPEDGESVLSLVWNERAGPDLRPPERTGFGTELLDRMSRSLGGDCELTFDGEGLTARLSMQSFHILDGHSA
ncbi:MAG: HWE histidine kinase domain-containing protein [Roseitalea porphyridii]|uniref:HWE histidine kinase domain-containing protein n=1 Tax=Roseitalea porphyridii TaxID=1852022 RepID=UPI0032ECE265